MNKILIDIPQQIETPRLMLQMPKAGYGKKVYNAITDGYEDYIKYLNWPKEIPTEEASEIDCRKHNAEFITRECIRYLIIEKETGEVIGRCAFPPLYADWAIPQFSISYFISKSKRAKGYATEASHALTLLAFKVLNAKKVEIYCESENVASKKVPQKLNYKLEFTKRGGWPRPDGQLAELNVYSIFNEKDLPELKLCRW